MSSENIQPHIYGHEQLLQRSFLFKTQGFIVTSVVYLQHIQCT